MNLTLRRYAFGSKKMSDDELVTLGKAAAFMCSPAASFGDPPRKEFVIQLDEARTEWLRRHPARK
jgi:hypothetical protein